MRPFFQIVEKTGLIALLFLSTPSLGETASPVSSERGSKNEQKKKQLAETLAARILGGDFQTSLAAREATDFLLAPVFSVREALAHPSSAPIAGKEAPTVAQFDVIYDLNQAIDRTHGFVFARCWVSSEFYRVEIIWSEPRVQGLQFHLAPPSLSIQGDAGNFSISNNLLPSLNGCFAKPSLRPSPFLFRYGDYPVSNLQFADREYSDELPLRAILRKLMIAENSSTKEPLPLVFDKINLTKSVARIESERQGARVVTFEESDKTNHVLKQFNFKITRSNELQELSVHTPEQKTLVGFRGEGATVKLNTNVFQVKEFPLSYERGGRICTTTYEGVLPGTSLPARIELREAKSNAPLQTVRLTNFHLAPLTRSEVNRNAEEFKALGGIGPKYYSVAGKIARLNSSTGDAGDLKIGEFTTDFGRIIDQSTNTLGERLATSSMLADLNTFIGNQTEALRESKKYLSMLSENQLAPALLSSGVGMIEKAAQNRRPQQANELLDYWLDAVSKVNQPQGVLLFAANQVDKGNFILVIKLLEKLDDQWNTPDKRLEKSAIYFLAAHPLANLLELQSQKIHEPSSDLSLAAEMNPNQLKQAANKSLEEFHSLVGNIDSLNSFQKGLKNRVDKMTGATQQSAASTKRN